MVIVPRMADHSDDPILVVNVFAAAERRGCSSKKLCLWHYAGPAFCERNVI
ncbi:hypothetical protein SAMN04488032_10233 [Pacificibacter marinus]|uniref:Uncharacterized protein n=1 Tax=Pacificibacter marinus TaxID=658057 RepID=A0A1Y5S1E3_9RHOB|nr:hypothetical protein SAMN04488032_10233 [Pacificibacter marinus]SLN27449.1 hypothetical protein PAM7971_01055 [Pacificibacter marinus]